MFEKVNTKVDFPAEEERILRFWRENRVFEKSVELRRDCEEFVFYDGPPFANGLPHYGHLLANTIKDVVPRYQTMRGKYVERVFGWDCHGLPVENEMEKELGINSKPEIEAYGIDRFNEACRGIVLRYTAEWEEIINRLGRWVDFANGYRTMDREYMESIWWVFKRLWDRGLVYQGNKIMAYCPRCATPLSNFETSQGYQDVEDPSITVRFAVAGQPNTYLLAWTTTPWTLPSNLALAVGPEIEYVTVQDGDERYIMAAERLESYYRNGAPEIVARCPGSELAGTQYEPLFPYFAAQEQEGAFRVLVTDFVSTEDGTGTVHMAPGFGEDDARVCADNGIAAVCPVDAQCNYTAEIPEYAGRFVKDCDKEIMQRLKAEGKVVHRSTYRHSYPHCWRCEAPLIYRGVSTWFVDVGQIKESMLRANEQIRWVPEHIKDGRFGKWLEGARDWAVSRNRYWGCPLPVWRNEETGESLCVGSIAELEELSGQQIDDIHKHLIDDIMLRGPGGDELRRVPEVLDCWFESGSMPYAQRHYPFENKEWLEQHFPADFIAEGLDQTRGWFYTLVVLGAALFDKPSFRNVVVNGMILAEDGRKMSKRLKNYPDPLYIMETYGADALRLYLLSSPVVRGEDLCFSETGVKDTLRNLILPLWNSYSFFVTYALVDNWQPQDGSDRPPSQPANALDEWILSRLEGMVRDLAESMDAYDLQSAASRFNQFTSHLTNWYIRLSRRRFWKSSNDADKQSAYATLYHVLVAFCKAAAPYIPFVAEMVYRNLRTDSMPESVHLCDFPEPASEYFNETLDRQMERAMSAVSLGRYLRRQAEIRVRQPLRSVRLVSLDQQVRDDLAAMRELIVDELNVKEMIVGDDEEELVTLGAKPNYPKLGPRLGKSMKAAAKAVAALSSHDVGRLLRGETLPLDLGNGDSISIGADDIEIRREEKSGLAVANEGDINVALDVALDGELEDEGWAREIVHLLQNLRKEANLDVADRIHVRYAVPTPLAAAIEAHRGYIAAETLATEMTMDLQMENGTKQQVGPWDCCLTVEKAAKR